MLVRLSIDRTLNCIKAAAAPKLQLHIGQFHNVAWPQVSRKGVSKAGRAAHIP